MPPRKLARQNTEQLLQEFEKFQESEEYQLMRELASDKRDLPEISTSTDDLTDNFQPFLDKFLKLAKIYKCKPKKEFKHEYFRGVFFGGIASGTSQNIPREIDKVTYIFVKSDNDSAYKVRQNFLAVMTFVEELDQLTEKNFQENKKKIAKLLKDFCTEFDKYAKGPHEKIHDVLVQSLLKLRCALESNFKLSLFDFNHEEIDNRKINDFKEQAYLSKFCEDLQAVFVVLYDTAFIKDNPPLEILAAKFKIENWRGNKIQSYFIEPLYQTWNKLRKEMIRMYAFGEDHWVVPYGKNLIFTEHVVELIRLELICERLLGNTLKRDQLNFMFNTILYVFNSPAKEGMINNSTVVMESTIPNLLILRYLDHIVKITQVKRKESEKNSRRKELLESLLIKPVEKEEYKDQPVEEEKKSPEKPKPQISAAEKEDTEDDMRVYGRYWIWYDYFPEGFEKEVIAAAEELRKVNIAVRQDMADYFISKGLTTKTHMFQNKGHQNRASLQKKEQPVVTEEDKIRAPKLWNHPDIIEKQHNYRPNANPQICYEDKRIQDMEKRIESLARSIQEYTPIRWKELVERTVQFFKDFPEEKHKAIPIPLDHYEYVYP
jgi:hypothetical protein